MIDPKVRITNQEEKSIAETYGLDDFIKQMHDRYSALGKVIYDAMTEEGVGLREIGAMIGILARDDTELNKSLLGRKISLFGNEVSKIRDIFGMRVLEDP